MLSIKFFQFIDKLIFCRKNCKLIEEKSSGKKSESLETILAVTKKEKQELVSKLFEAQYGRTGELETFEKRLEEKTRLLELCEAERNKLQREVAKAQAENSVSPNHFFCFNFES